MTFENGISKSQINAEYMNQQSKLAELVGKGMYQLLEPGNFPLVDPVDVHLGRFFATDNNIDRLRSAMEIADVPQLKKRLALRISDLIRRRDLDLFHALGTDDRIPDMDIVYRQAMFRQAGDLTQAMRVAIELGLPDQINPRNFPALRAATPAEIAFLRLQALQSKLRQLESFRPDARDKDSGYHRNGDVDDGKALNEEITKVREQYRLELEEYLVLSK